MFPLKHPLALSLAAMVLILLLCCLSVDGIKSRVTGVVSSARHAKVWLQRSLHISLSSSQLLNLLHVPFFAALAFLWMEFFRRRETSCIRAALLTLGAVLLFSVFTELLQGFVAGRSESLIDVALDLVGAIMGLGTWVLVASRRHSLKKAADQD